MKAIILAGGMGRRLAPYTTVFPKPLMPIGNVPILEVIIRQLKRAEFNEITLAVGHLAELILAYFGDGSKWNVKIDYSREEEPLGTAGPIGLVSGLNESFLVMNGDLLTTIDFRAFRTYHHLRGTIATLATFQRDVKIDLGVIDIDEQNRVQGYIEKPTYHYTVSTGIYMFEPPVLNYIPKHVQKDLPELVLDLMTAGEEVAAYPFRGIWLDIGRPEDYEHAAVEFEQHYTEFLSS